MNFSERQNTFCLSLSPHRGSIYYRGDTRALRRRIGNVNRTTFLPSEEQFSGRSTFLAATAFVGPIKDASPPFHAYRNYGDALVESIRVGRATPLFETADSIFSVKFRLVPPSRPSRTPYGCVPIWWYDVERHSTAMAAVSFQPMTRLSLETG